MSPFTLITTYVSISARAIALALVVFALSACGQRGDLVLPQTSDKPSDTEQQAPNP
jgi:predicted small lipoprotein YifL